MALSIALLINSVYSKIKNNLFRLAFILMVFSALSFQTFETYSWFPIKWSTNPRQLSSDWIIRNVPKGTLIGIENIPIYQFLPDVVQKEFYLIQYGQKVKTNYRYQVISSKNLTFPKVIIITNDEIETSYLKKSDKKNLIKRLNNEGYEIIAKFKPNFKYYKIFNSELEYFISGLVQAPNTVSVYEKL